MKRLAMAGAVLMLTLGISGSTAAEDARAKETARKVRKASNGCRYGVFDFLSSAWIRAQ
jgi:hypothetical protein